VHASQMVTRLVTMIHVPKWYTVTWFVSMVHASQMVTWLLTMVHVTQMVTMKAFGNNYLSTHTWLIDSHKGTVQFFNNYLEKSSFYLWQGITTTCLMYM